MDDSSHSDSTPQPRGFHPFRKLEDLLARFSPAERLALYIGTALLAGSTLALLAGVNSLASVVVPSKGGTLVEGAVGTPRFINPLLAISQTDQDLVLLTYSGLMRAMPDGRLVPDLAENYEVAEDGAVYRFYLRPDAVFHDGTPVTANDVLFTVLLAQNPDVKSPRRADWDGVVARALDERTIEFSLPHAYAPFLENTQLGILPKHLWESVPYDEFPFHQMNTRPVGSGPYKVESVETDAAGAALSYSLVSFDRFALGEPHLSEIVFKFFPNEEVLRTAFAAEEIDGFAGMSVTRVALEERSDTRLSEAPSTRLFGIFFNQNRSTVLADAGVREALDLAIDREQLIRDTLAGYGEPARGPIPPGLNPEAVRASSSDEVALSETEDDAEAAEDTESESEQSEASADEEASTEEAPPALATGTQAARDALAEAGWTFDEVGQRWMKGETTLTFALATADTPELVATAEAVAAMWRAAGVDVGVQIYPLAEFNATVLRPRSYDAVLFGQVVGHTLDLFAFWHSSQRNDPGLNLALYASTRADRLLESARTETDKNERTALHDEFAGLVAEERPAIFLYAPEFLYVAPSNIQNVALGALTTASERFLNVHEWYTDTERVWDIFAK